MDPLAELFAMLLKETVERLVAWIDNNPDGETTIGQWDGWQADWLRANRDRVLVALGGEHAQTGHWRWDDSPDSPVTSISVDVEKVDMGDGRKSVWVFPADTQ